MGAGLGADGVIGRDRAGHLHLGRGQHRVADELARRGALIRGQRGPPGEDLGAQFGLAQLDIGHVTHRTCGPEHLPEFASVQAWLLRT